MYPQMKIKLDNLELKPERHLKAAGYDLKAKETMTIKTGESALVPTGVYLQLPENIEAQVRPRSGLALKHQITVLNSPGTVDEDYKGQVCVILINHGKEDYTVIAGQKIAQLVFNEVKHFSFLVVDQLEDTERGSNGFGSSGK